MAAISTAVFSFLKAGDHCVAQTPVYGGTHEVFSLLETFGVQVTRVKLSADGNVDDFKAAIKENTKLLYAESPANPICRVLDLQAFGALGKVIQFNSTMLLKLFTLTGQRYRHNGG